MVSDTHGRDHVTHGELALDEQGKILAARIHATCSVGAYPFQNGPNVPIFNGGRVTGQAYDIPIIHHEIRCVFTNNTPTDTYRGGRPAGIGLHHGTPDGSGCQCDGARFS